MKKLLEKVRAIDKDAADYIESHILPRHDVSPGLLQKISKMSLEGQLSSLFFWGESPQVKDDPEYWHKIYKQIEG